MVIGNGAVMIGMGERTTPQGVEILARSCSHGSVDKVIAVELPKTRAFMHLDTAMTMVDRDAFSVYPYLPDELVRSRSRRGGGRRLHARENNELFPLVAEALGVERSGYSDPDRRDGRPASSGTTATTSWPSPQV